MELSPIAVESVKNLEASGRQLLEGILGQKLQENQQIFIMVLSPGKEPDEQARRAHAGLEMIFKKTEQQAREHQISEQGIDAASQEYERVCLGDLPTPPEVAEEAMNWCKKYGWQREEVEEQLKLQYYFGGQAVYIVRTPGAPVVIPITKRYQELPDLRYVLLRPEERLHASLEVPPPWRDSANEILI